MRVLGIDPGTGRLGWAVVEKRGGKESLIDSGCLETKANSKLAWRLEKIYDFLLEIIDKYSPEEMAVEDLFFAKNAKTVMAVGAALGVVLLAGQKRGLSIANYSPMQVKATIAGYGKADKKQIQYMIGQILKLKETIKPDDAADAVAVALTHLSRSRMLQ